MGSHHPWFVPHLPRFFVGGGWLFFNHTQWYSGVNFWVCTQQSLLVVLRGPYRMLGIKFRVSCMWGMVCSVLICTYISTKVHFQSFVVSFDLNSLFLRLYCMVGFPCNFMWIWESASFTFFTLGITIYNTYDIILFQKYSSVATSHSPPKYEHSSTTVSVESAFLLVHNIGIISRVWTCIVDNLGNCCHFNTQQSILDVLDGFCNRIWDCEKFTAVKGFWMLRNQKFKIYHVMNPLCFRQCSYILSFGGKRNHD